jgi:ABC-type lipoprotein export system ATPase subunit
MSQETVLEARGLYKEYDGETVLADVDFQLHAGEVVILRGASGVGKSTLLSMLGLLLTPSAGMVFVQDAPVEDADDKELSRLRAECFGFIFQHTQLIGSLRVMENVCIPAMLAGRRDMSDRAHDLLCGYGLEDRLEHYPHQISVGQKRRVAVARAQLLSPAIILADEPTNDLDVDNAAKVCGYLRDAANAGQGVLIATHDEMLAAHADRTVTLKGGYLE